jgi:hypothetical protein
VLPAKKAASPKGKAEAAKGAKLTTSSDSKSTGRMKMSLYTKYLGEWGPFYLLPTVFFTMAMIERSFQIVQNSWLSVSCRLRVAPPLPPSRCSPLRVSPEHA